MPSNKPRIAQLEILLMLLKPLVRFCLRNSHLIHDFEQMAKRAFLEVAEEEIRKSTKKVNVSRLAVMTGMYRREVTRYFRETEPVREEPLSVLGRVVGQWRHDRRFVSKSGKPKILDYKGDDSAFKDLCTSITSAINHGTILFELRRLGYVRDTEDGVELVREVFGFSSDQRAGYELLARDIETLIISAEENMTKAHPISNLHIRTEYDNISQDSLDKARKWLLLEGKKFHKKVREFLSKLDKDVNSKLADKEGGAQVALGTFSFAARSRRT